MVGGADGWSHPSNTAGLHNSASLPSHGMGTQFSISDRSCDSFSDSTSDLDYYSHLILPLSLLYVSLALTNDSYFDGSVSRKRVTLCDKHSISFRVPSGPMDASLRSKSSKDLLWGSICAIAIAPVIPIGVSNSHRVRSVVFPNKAHANSLTPSA